MSGTSFFFPSVSLLAATSCTSRQLQHPIAVNGFHRTGCLVAEWKPWQQEAGRIFSSPRRKGSLFLGPEPSYSLVLHFAVNFNSGELAWKVLGLSWEGRISDLSPFCLDLYGRSRCRCLASDRNPSSARTGGDGCFRDDCGENGSRQGLPLTVCDIFLF